MLPMPKDFNNVFTVKGSVLPSTSKGATPLKVYLLTQTVRTGANTFDSCVVIAFNEDDARIIHPTGDSPWPEDGFGTRCWVSSDCTHLVKVEEVGIHNGSKVAGTVLCASFNYN